MYLTQKDKISQKSSYFFKMYVDIIFRLLYYVYIEQIKYILERGDTNKITHSNNPTVFLLSTKGLCIKQSHLSLQKRGFETSVLILNLKGVLPKIARGYTPKL